MQRSTRFQNEGFSQRSSIPLPGQPIAQVLSASATRYVLQEHQGFHVVPCGCLYDSRIQNLGSNRTHCELPLRFASSFYNQNFILNTAATPDHPDLQYLSPLYCSPSDQNNSIYQPPPVYYQTPILIPSRNQVAYSTQLFPINSKTHVLNVPARFYTELLNPQIQLQQHHNLRQNQNTQLPKTLKSEDAMSKTTPLPVDTSVQESASDQQTSKFSPTSNDEQKKQKCIIASTSNETRLTDDEEKMLAALDAVSEELNELISNVETAKNQDSTSPINHASDTLPDEVSLEDAMKMFDCTPFHDVLLNNPSIAISGKLSDSADLDEFSNNIEITQEKSEEQTIAESISIIRNQMSNLPLTDENNSENSMGFLALPKGLMSSDYEVPELEDIITTMDFFYSVSIYGLFNAESSDCNPLYNLIKDSSCDLGLNTLPKPGEISLVSDSSPEKLDLTRKEKRHSTDTITHSVSKKSRIADSAALEAVQEFCAVSMSTTMKKRLGIED